MGLSEQLLYGGIAPDVLAAAMGYDNPLDCLPHDVLQEVGWMDKHPDLVLDWYRRYGSVDDYLSWLRWFDILHGEGDFNHDDDDDGWGDLVDDDGEY